MTDMVIKALMPTITLGAIEALVISSCATYVFMFLVAVQSYGPFNVVKHVYNIIKRIVGKDCPICISVWVSSMFLALPVSVTLPVAASMLFLYTEYAIMEENSDG